MQNHKKLNGKVILAILAAGIMAFAGIVVETAMNITFPTLMAEFGVGISTVQWMTTGYLLVVAIIIPLSSFFKRRFKTKHLFLVAILLFSAGVLIDALAPTFPILLFGRIIQGCGTGIALPLMFNIILDQVPLEKLGFMMGIPTLITAVAPAIGPTYGGYVVSTFSWRSIFLFLLPLLVFSLITGSISIEQARPLEKIKLDFLSLLFIILTFVGIVFGFSRAGEDGWTNALVLGSLFIGLAALALFVKRSLGITNPIIHLDIFQTPSFKWSALSIFLVQLIILGLSFILPNYTQIVLGNSALTAGLLVLPGSIVGAALAPFSGRLLDVVGPKMPILTGSVLSLLSLFLFALIGQALDNNLILWIYLLFMAGIGFAFGNTITNGLKLVPPERNADANALFNTVQQLAGAIGTSVVATIVATSQNKQASAATLSYNELTAAGSVNAFLFLTALALISTLALVMVFRMQTDK